MDTKTLDALEQDGWKLSKPESNMVTTPLMIENAKYRLISASKADSLEMMYSSLYLIHDDVSLILRHHLSMGQWEVYMFYYEMAKKLLERLDKEKNDRMAAITMDLRCTLYQYRAIERKRRE